MLHRVLRRHLETFLARLEDGNETGSRGLPSFVERELRGILTCGDPAHGFARVRCLACHHELLVPFS